MSETYYDILNISPEATEENIKKVYRKIAIKYHPDKKPGDKEAEEIFKKATEAYEILKNSKKRYIYNKKIKLEKSKYDRFRKGQDLKIRLKVKIEDLIKGIKKLIIIERKGLCPDCDGTGSASKELKKCIYCNGTGVQGLALIMGNIKKCSYCLGAAYEPIGKKCQKCKGTALVPETIYHEITLNPVSRFFTIKKLGNCCFKGESGDLYVELIIEENSLYKVKKLDVTGYIKITPSQAILGDTLILSVFDKKIRIKILPGTQNNAMIKIDKGGITYKNDMGHFKAIVNIIIPTVISNKEKELYQKIFDIERETSWPKILNA